MDRHVLASLGNEYQVEVVLSVEVDPSLLVKEEGGKVVRDTSGFDRKVSTVIINQGNQGKQGNYYSPFFGPLPFQDFEPEVSSRF